MIRLALILSATLALSACASVGNAIAPVAAALAPSVDASALVLGPPSGAMADAEAAFVRGPWHEARRARAVADDQFDPFSALGPVMGGGFTAEHYPLTAEAFARLRTPLGAAILTAKSRFDRERPFEVDSAVTPCIAVDDRLRASGAYPSGHAAFGWAWALVLAELDPDRADAILARGREFGDSRVVCGLHYPSDVEAGRVIAAGTLARLHAEPGFRAALDAARTEYAH
jgi:acid phosphatase (class A)